MGRERAVLGRAMGPHRRRWKCGVSITLQARDPNSTLPWIGSYTDLRVITTTSESAGSSPECGTRAIELVGDAARERAALRGTNRPRQGKEKNTFYLVQG
jgi:hypothetical protein